MMSFNPQHIDTLLLRNQSYNLRWAEVNEDVIPLTAADLDLPVAEPIAETIIQFTKNRCFNYGPADGWPALKKSYATYFQRKRFMEISDSQILPVNSAAFGIHLVCKSLLQSGDEAIILNPVDFLFRYAIEEVGAKAVAFSVAANDNETDFSNMEALINSNTKLICLCNPVNPTGRVFSRVELECLLMIAEKHSLVILSDEIWSDIVYEPHAFISIGSIKNAIHSNVIIVSGMSKSYGLAGLRIGVVATGNKKLYDHLFKMSLHSSTIHGISVLSQVAAVAALDHCDPWLNDFVAHLERMRNNCVAALNRLDGVSCHLPQGTYVAFADISKTGMNSQEMQQFLLNEAKVAVVPGLPQWFGSDAEGFIRLSFATSESILTQAMNRIESAFEKIPKPTTYVS